VRQICRCKLEGRVYYSRRCPVCGFYREGNNVNGWVPNRQDIEKYIQWERERKNSRREYALSLLRATEVACNLPIPSKPVVKRPSRPMNWRQEKSWSYRAHDWEVKTGAEIEKKLRTPFENLQKMVSAPVQHRYIRAAQKLLQARLQQLRDAGWELPGINLPYRAGGNGAGEGGKNDN